MEKTPLAIVGCGGMGGRHLLGLKELYESGLRNVDLAAVCDLRRDNAEHLADRAAELLGRRPLVFEDMSKMVSELPGLQAAAITTDTGSHHIVASAALKLGLHVPCEKPLALTMRGCNLILGAQQRSGKVLSVAENYRRDPMARLTKALVDAGAIERPLTETITTWDCLEVIWGPSSSAQLLRGKQAVDQADRQRSRGAGSSKRGFETRTTSIIFYNN